MLILIFDKSTSLIIPYSQKNGKNFHGEQPLKERISNSEDGEEEDIDPSRNLNGSSDSKEENNDLSSCYSHLGNMFLYTFDIVSSCHLI